MITYDPILRETWKNISENWLKSIPSLSQPTPSNCNSRIFFISWVELVCWYSSTFLELGWYSSTFLELVWSGIQVHILIWAGKYSSIGVSRFKISWNLHLKSVCESDQVVLEQAKEIVTSHLMVNTLITKLTILIIWMMLILHLWGSEGEDNVGEISRKGRVMQISHLFVVRLQF